MQAQRQIEVGDKFQHHVTGIIIEIMSLDKIDFLVREVYPTHSPSYYVDAIALGMYWTLYSSPSQQLLNQVYQSLPTVGEIWVHQKTGEEWEILSVNYPKDEATVFCLSPSGIGRQGSVKFVTLFADCKPKLTTIKNPFLGNKVPAFYGIAPATPGPLLPPGQSNEFFGISMTELCKRCTCGIDSIGGGKHSDWCDKHDKEENT